MNQCLLEATEESLSWSSNRVFDINKLMPQPEALCQVFSQRLDAVTFRGMVAGGVIMNAAFAGNVYRLLGNFTADEGIQTL